MPVLFLRYISGNCRVQTNFICYIRHEVGVAGNVLKLHDVCLSVCLHGVAGMYVMLRITL